MRPFLYSALAIICLSLPLTGCDDQQQASSSSAVPENVAASPSALEGEGVDADVVDTGTTTSGAAETPQSDVPPPAREIFSDAACSFEEWVGTPLAEVEAAAKETGRPVRVLTPDSMMIMDHAPDRINVVHKDGNVTRVWCG